MEIDWDKVQKYYDDSHSILETQMHFGFGYGIRRRAIKEGKIILRDRSSRQCKKLKAKINDSVQLQKLVELYNTGHSIRELCQKGFLRRQYYEAVALKLIKPRSKQESQCLAIKKYGPRVMSREKRLELSVRQSLSNTGGKCKWFTVAGQRVQGTWERDIAEKFEELGIKWYKPQVKKDVWIYTRNGCEKSYTPDFYLPDLDIYLEVKGYWWGDDKEKMDLVLAQHSNKRLVIILEQQYKNLLQGMMPW